MKPRYTLWIIIFLSLISLWLNVPKLSKNYVVPFFKLNLSDLVGIFPLNLGLELQGGTQLVLEADVSKLPEDRKDIALDSAREIIERRVNLFGVSESVVQTSKVGNQRRILVQLPGIQESEAAANLVGTTAQLEFREISLEASDTAIISIDNTTATDLKGNDLKKAEVVFNSSQQGNSGPQISLEFTPEGSKKFGELKKRNIGKQLPIFLDSTLLQAPVVQQEIVGGNAVITGQYTTADAKQIATQLNAGALPVPVKILEQRSIGASLGQASINKSVVAGLVGLVLVMVYMVAYYGLYGLVACFALVIYTLVTLAIFRTGLFLMPPVTLTLAGIAGFILSIGMAVDANILIFERMKEEKRAGNNPKTILDLGFKRAWSSIRDSNISSLITAGILYYLGSGLVKGFAVAFAIGVLVSMFTAITVTKTFLELLSRR